MNNPETDKEARRVVEGGKADQHAQGSVGKGDNRTPDKKIGQVEYADNHGEQKIEKVGEGGAGSPQTSKLEPEKQGGIGGP